MELAPAAGRVWGAHGRGAGGTSSAVGGGGGVRAYLGVQYPGEK